MSLRTLLLAASTLSATAAAAAGKHRLHARDWIASDEIVGFNQTVPDNSTGEIYLAYQPYLKVVNGCVPFPGVDAEGDTEYVPSPPIPPPKKILLISDKQ